MIGERAVPVPSRRGKKSRIKSSTIAVYASIFVLLVVLIGIGYRAPQQVSGASANALPTGQVEEKETTAVNAVVATNIAANVATTTNLSVAPSVTSLAISTQIESTLPSSDDSSISKPSIIQVSAASRNIASYTVQAGDTVDTLAAKFGISKDTIKWANNLTSDALTVGQSLQILPRTGIVYTVKSGDTIQSIAEKYKGDVSTITTYNDLEISGVTDGLKIIIPGGILPTNERPGYSAPVSSGYSFAGFRAGSVGNKYGYGYCTWYAYERRVALGRPIGSYWGDAGSWKRSGELSGYAVNRTPLPGALMVELGSPGHVGVVESVSDNGDVIISEMNNRAYGGWNVINNRSLSAGQAAAYWYVH
ncbi:MAG: LysM peptidoglycan-binding domain-containing protein [Candidatus Microsaccharimonas sp.]